MNRRKHGLIIGKKVFLNMTAAEVKKLSRIMSRDAREDDCNRYISLTEYVEKYEPETVRWISAKGTEMIRVKILHDVLDEREDWVEQPVFHADKKLLRLHAGEIKVED